MESSSCEWERERERDRYHCSFPPTCTQWRDGEKIYQTCNVLKISVLSLRSMSMLFPSNLAESVSFVGVNDAASAGLVKPDQAG